MRHILIAIAVLLGIGTASDAQTVGCCGNLPGGTTYLGQVATRSILPDGTAYTWLMTRSAHYFPNGATNIKIILPNFYVGVTNVETFPGSATFRASLEYPPGTCTQVTWGGISTASVTGALTVVSDAIAGVTIPPGTWAYFRIYTNSSIANAFTGALQGQRSPNIALGDFSINGNTQSAIPDYTGSPCTPTSSWPSAPAVNQALLTPIAILANTTSPAPCLIGDSIQAGFLAGQNASGDMGVMAPSLGPFFGYIMLAIGGTQAAQYVGYTLTGGNYVPHSAVRQSLYQYCSHMGDNYGINDVANGQTAAQLEANEEIIWNGVAGGSSGGHPVLPSIGFNGPIFHSTLTPYTTGDVATSGNQSVQSFESQRLLFNSWLRTPGNGPNGSYFDVENTVSTLSSGDIVWKDAATFPLCGTSPYWVNNESNTIANVHPSFCTDEYIQNSGTIQKARIAR